jgi:hypothetical protein
LKAPDIAFIKEKDKNAVRLFWDCPDINSTAELITPLSRVLLDHVDLRTTDREGGFAASFPDDEDNISKESPLRAKSVTVCIAEVPRLGVVGSAVAGVVAIFFYCWISRMPDYDATEAAVKHYNSVKAMHEGDFASNDGDGNAVDDNADVERGV